MPSYLQQLLSDSPIGEDPDQPCYILALPQELRDVIYGHVIKDEIPDRDAFLWLVSYRHQGRAYIGIPKQINMACCNRKLHFDFASLLVAKHPVGATLSLDGLHHLDLEETFKAIDKDLVNTIRSIHIVVHGGSRMTMHALLKWARLSYDGPLARDSRFEVTYDMDGCWDNGYDPCGDTHSRYIQPLLIDLRALALRMKEETAQAKSAGRKTEADCVHEFEQAVVGHMHMKGWSLPATAFCRGCSFNGVRFEHDELPDEELD